MFDNFFRADPEQYIITYKCQIIIQKTFLGVFYCIGVDETNSILQRSIRSKTIFRKKPLFIDFVDTIAYLKKKKNISSFTSTFHYRFGNSCARKHTQKATKRENKTRNGLM